MRFFFILIFCGLVRAGLCQESSAKGDIRYFHPGYLMLGLNMPNGNFKTAPEVGINAKENFLAGQIGEQNGFLFQAGRIFYFNSKAEILRYGLDWTVLSFSYNKLDWSAYSDAHGGTVGTAMILRVSTRIGPSITLNPTGKFTINAHFQIAPGVDLTGLEYSKSASAATDNESLYLATNKIFQNTGFKTNFGIYVRWGIFGLAFDYISGGVDYHYQYTNQQTGEGGNSVDDAPVLKQKLTSSAFEIKLIL